MYSRKKRIGRGRFGNVYESTVQGSAEAVAVKVLDMPLSMHDPCTLCDLYTEVAILETLKSLPLSPTLHHCHTTVTPL
jgi:biotin-(acetyl-CoA carboxylase) ligase